MRTALPILLVVALVAGVTFITQFSVTPPPTANPSSGPSAADLPPLEWPTALVGFDPTPAALDTPAVEHLNKRFPGFFELGVEGNLVPFHFRAPRPEGIQLFPAGRSCGKCTNARGAVIPPDAFDRYAQSAAVGSILGPGLPNPIAALAWGELYAGLKWHQFDFEKPLPMMSIPPAPAADRPTVGIIELAFKIGTVDKPNTVHAGFDVYSADGKAKLQPQPYSLSVHFAGRDPFEVLPNDLNVGELAEGAEPKVFEVVAFSAVRGPADFPPPALATPVPDPFLTVGTPLPLTAADLDRVSYLVSEQNKFPMRVRSGYRFPVTVRREVGGKTLDVGKLERELFAASPATQKTYRITVTGTVTGLVRLETGTKIDFGIYQADYDQKRLARLVSDRPDLDLELVPAESGPRWVTFTLGPPERDGRRTVWPVQAQIRAKTGREPPWEGTLTLRTKGPNPTTVRVPVTGHGR